MQTRMNRIVVGAVCGLALSLLAVPMARAQGNNRPQALIVFQSGDAQNIKVNSGDASAAQQCAALFSGSHHIGYDDGAWVLWTPNGQQIVVCLPKDVSYDEQQMALSIKGTIGSGTFAGAVVTGKLYLRGRWHDGRGHSCLARHPGRRRGQSVPAPRRGWRVRRHLPAPTRVGLDRRAVVDREAVHPPSAFSDTSPPFDPRTGRSIPTPAGFALRATPAGVQTGRKAGRQQPS
jgi:hypothetical protein